jgi:hypothetical protein
MKRFRRNAEYATDSRAFRPIDRNQRIRIITIAEALELRTKAKGQKSGVLGLSGLQLLRCLLFRFCAIPTGRCCPSYRTIREATGFCYSTISGALRRLETSRILQVTRRLIRTPHGARQITNAYAFSETASGARKPDYENSRETTNLFKNIRRQPTLPGLKPVPLPFHLQSVRRALNPLKPNDAIMHRDRGGVP